VRLAWILHSMPATIFISVFFQENPMNRFLKPTLIALAVAATGAAFAQAKAEPDPAVSFNVGAVSDYRYRGISQSGAKPAVSAGVDAAFKSGFYVGAWASSITWIKDSGSGAKGPIEVDLYGGYKGEIQKDLGYDVGVLQYAYLGNSYDKVSTANANTTEIYGAITAGAFTAKLSNSVTNLFGTAKSKNSTYVDFSYTLDLGNGLTVVPHIGNQKIKGFGDYIDYSVAVNKDMDGLVLSATLVGTNWKSRYGADYNLPGSGTKNLAGNSIVLGIKKNF
jgi:uncharacterized protein (TIGR02001 family)